LTDEQRRLWIEGGFEQPLIVAEGQTRKQAENLAVDTFRWLCGFEGVPVPPEPEIRRLA
jgi:hypothetical protein